MGGAAGRCDFLATTDVGRRVPAEEVEAVSAVSELEVREWLDEQGGGAEEVGAGGTPLFLPRPTSWRLQERCRGTSRFCNPCLS